MNGNGQKVVIQGHRLCVSISDNGAYYAPQWTRDINDELKFEHFTELLNFNNPVKALKELYHTIVSMSDGHDKPLYLIGSTEKRTRVYAMLLKRGNIPFRVVHEPIDNDLALEVL